MFSTTPLLTTRDHAIAVRAGVVTGLPVWCNVEPYGRLDRGCYVVYAVGANPPPAIAGHTWQLYQGGNRAFVCN